MEDDGFGMWFFEEEEDGLGVPAKRSSVPTLTRTTHKAGPVNVVPFLQRLMQVYTGANLDRLFHMVAYSGMVFYGRRNLSKSALDQTHLTPAERYIFQDIQRKLEDPVRRERVMSFIHQKDVTMRLIHYFVVHYALKERELSYFLDRTRYPYRIIGQVGDIQHNQEALRLRAAGRNVVQMNLYREYKNSKTNGGFRNRHAPYRRGTTVKGEDGEVYSLTQLNFFLWFDEVGGMEVFRQVEEDVRLKKALYDEYTRRRDPSEKRKDKVVPRVSKGINSQIRVLPYRRRQWKQFQPSREQQADVWASLMQ